MGKKQLAINMFANLIAFMVSLLISFILTPYLISTIGKEAYAFYPISTNFIGYLSIVSIALNSMASRFITIELVRNNIQKAQTYYSSVFFANLVLAALLSLPMLVIVIWIDIFLNVPSEFVWEVKLLFGLVFCAMIINIISSVFGVATFALNRLELRSGSEIFQGFVKLGLYVFLFSVFDPTIVFIGLVALILSVVNGSIQFIFSRKLLPHFQISIKYFDITAVKNLMSSGIWNSINSLGSLLLFSVSLLLANILIGASASGDLAIVQILPSFISTIITVLFGVFLPRLIHVFAERNRDNLIRETKLSQRVIGLLSTTPILLIIIFGQDFFRLWVPTADSVRLQTLSVITIVPLIIHGNMWTIYGLNIVLNKIRIPSLVLIGLGFINIVSSYLLISYFNGDIYVIPLVSSVISVLYYFFFVPVYAAVQLDIDRWFFHPHILKTILFSTVAITSGMYLRHYISIITWLDLFSWSALYGFILLVVNIALILKKEDLVAIKTSLQNAIFA